MGKADLESKLLSRVQEASSFLVPQSAADSSLSDVKPYFGGVFVFEAEDGGGDIRLEIEFKDTGGACERVLLRWCRLERERHDVTSILSLSSIDMEK